MNDTIGFVGVGGMGLPMATNLLRAGHKLRIYNRTKEKAQPLAELGGEIVSTPAEAVTPGGIVMTMISDDAALESVTTGTDGFLDRLGPNGIHVSHATVSVAIARRMAELHRVKGAHYLGCPVFGKPEVAEKGMLWVILAGDPEAKQRVEPLLEAVGQQIFDFGEDPDAANVIKLAGNFLLGSAVEAMAEAFTLAQNHGIERQKVHDLFSSTLFDCFVYKAYGQLVADDTYKTIGARPSLIRKDYNLILEAANEGMVPMPLAQLIHSRITATVAKGRDDIDWAGFAKEVSEAAGVEG